MPSTTPASARPRPRTIDANDRKRGLQIPDSWLRGVLAGAEGVLGTWLLVVVPAVAVYIATAAAPELGSASWVEASQLGTGVWLAAHGAHLQVGEVTFTLLPLGVSLLAFTLTAAAIRRAALDTWAGVLLAVVTYLAGTLLLVRVVAAPGGLRALGGAAVIAVGAAAWALRRDRPALSRQLTDRWSRVRERSREWVASRDDSGRLRAVLAHGATAVRAGAATATRTLAGVLLVAAVGLAVSVVIAFPLIRGVHERLEPDLVSSAVLTGAQILMLPTLLIWTASYFSGAGFTLGEGTLYSPGLVTSAPLPSVPVLGALPNPEGSIAQAPAWGYVYLLVGALAGWYLHRWMARRSGGEPHLGAVAGAVLVAGATVAVALAIAGGLASGGFGPGRFAADVGPRVASFVGSTAWQLAVPMFAVVVALNPFTHRWVLRGWRRATSSIRGREPA